MSPCLPTIRADEKGEIRPGTTAISGLARRESQQPDQPDLSEIGADESPDNKDSFSNDWREYFSLEEMENAYKKLNAGLDPNDAEEEEEENNGDLTGSDSNPSEGNLEKEEMQDFMESLRQTEAELSPSSHCDAKVPQQLIAPD